MLGIRRACSKLSALFPSYYLHFQSIMSVGGLRTGKWSHKAVCISLAIVSQTFAMICVQSNKCAFHSQKPIFTVASQTKVDCIPDNTSNSARV